MAIVITQSDFAAIGQMTKHCDTGKLQIAVQETIMFDMKRLFGSFWFDLETNFDSGDLKWTDVMAPREYTAKEKTYRHEGVKNILLYFAYSRYVVLNGFNDTPTGHVTKTNEFSIPKPLKELNTFADKYREMAISLYNGVQHFLCENKTNYPAFNSGGCVACKEPIQQDAITGHSVKSKTISKWDV